MLRTLCSVFSLRATNEDEENTFQLPPWECPRTHIDTGLFVSYLSAYAQNRIASLPLKISKSRVKLYLLFNHHHNYTTCLFEYYRLVRKYSRVGIRGLFNFSDGIRSTLTDPPTRSILPTMVQTKECIYRKH